MISVVGNIKKTFSTRQEHKANKENSFERVKKEALKKPGSYRSIGSGLMRHVSGLNIGSAIALQADGLQRFLMVSLHLRIFLARGEEEEEEGTREWTLNSVGFVKRLC
jgi:hypothetical protein